MIFSPDWTEITLYIVFFLLLIGSFYVTIQWVVGLGKFPFSVVLTVWAMTLIAGVLIFLKGLFDFIIRNPEYQIAIAIVLVVIIYLWTMSQSKKNAN